MTQPFTAKLVPKAQFLSGNIPRKLRHSKAAAVFDPRFNANVPLLEAATPERLTMADIEVRLGMHWLPLDLIQRFVFDTLKVWASLRFNEVADTWVIAADGSEVSDPNYTQYGVQWEQGNQTKRVTGVDLMQLSLNLQVPTIRRIYVSGESPQIDPTLTASARQKQMLLQQAFVNWVRDDDDRRQKLESRYNLLFNAVKITEYDGSHLTLEGMSAAWQAKVRSRSYQLDDIWRCLSSPYNTGLWLEPGLGKTQVLIATAMTAVLFGKAHKCLIVVQKKTLNQYRETVPAMYPNARTLIATKADCGKGRLDLFIARVMNSDADMVVLTHQMFERLNLRPETWQNYVQARLTRVEQQLQQLNPSRSTRKQAADVKRLLRMENNLKERLKVLKEAHSKGLCLEDMGFDWYAFDEAHRYKRQGVVTKQYQVAGIPTGSSGCGEFFRVVRHWVHQTYGSGALIKATGTPINNSAVEAFIELWDLMPETMDAMGLGSLDSCIAQFGDITREPEVKPNGTIALTTRLADFQNIPELKRLLFAAATVRTAEEVNLPVPKARYINVVAPMSPQQLAYMQYLLHRTELIKARSPMEWERPATDDDIRKGKTRRKHNPETGETEHVRVIVDNNLLVSTHGREACLHYNVRDPKAPDFKHNKVRKCARRIFNIWQRTREGKATQLVFLNMSTPNNPDFSVYRELKGLLMTMGMPEDQCVFIQDYETEDDLDQLYDDMNAGSIAVLIGGEQMGVGLNVQERVLGLHVLSLPWRPDIFEQFIKRGERYGNLNPTVRIYTYGTSGVKGSTGFDPFILGHIKRKNKMRTSVLSKDMTVRRLHEESESPAFSYAQLEALLTGDDRIMQLCKMETELEIKLQLIWAAEQDMYRMKHGSEQGIPFSRAKIEADTRWLKRHAPDFDLVLQHLERGLTTDAFAVTIQEVELTDPLEAAKAFAELAAQLVDSKQFDQWRMIGAYGGFDIVMMATESRRVLMNLRSEFTRWDVRFTQNPYTFANDRRLQFAYEEILDWKHRTQKQIDRHTQRINEQMQRVQALEAQIVPMRMEVQALELGVAKLRQELGCDEPSPEIDFSTIDIEGENID